MQVRLQEEAFSPGVELDRFTMNAAGIGAIVSFTGIMRSTLEDPIAELFIEHYSELATSIIGSFVDAAIQRFSISTAEVIHRHGLILPGEPIMQVMTSAPHRAAAFAGAEFLMDWLKTDAPFWKRETRANGAEWVAPRVVDDLARQRWGD